MHTSVGQLVKEYRASLNPVTRSVLRSIIIKRLNNEVSTNDQAREKKA